MKDVSYVFRGTGPFDDLKITLSPHDNEMHIDIDELEGVDGQSIVLSLPVVKKLSKILVDYISELESKSL